MVYCRHVKGVSSLKLHEGVTLLWKKTIQNGKYFDLEAEPPCVHLA